MMVIPQTKSRSSTTHRARVPTVPCRRTPLQLNPAIPTHWVRWKGSNGPPPPWGLHRRGPGRPQRPGVRPGDRTHNACCCCHRSRNPHSCRVTSRRRIPGPSSKCGCTGGRSTCSDALTASVHARRVLHHCADSCAEEQATPLAGIPSWRRFLPRRLTFESVICSCKVQLPVSCRMRNCM